MHHKDYTIAIVLVLLLGGIGGHWFYLGQYKKGLIYLLLAWTFIPELLAIITLIKWLMMGKEDWERKYSSPPSPDLP